MTKKLNLEEATAHLGLSKVATLKALVRDREITFTKVGRQVVFEESWLDDYIETHKVEPVSNPWGLTDSSLANLRSDRASRRAS